MNFAEAALLGLIQGVVEWLPVSSEGVVATAHTLFFQSSLAESVSFSLWLHLGTALSALSALRGDAADAVRGAIGRPLRPTPMVVFLTAATLVSAPIGFWLLTGLEGFSERAGAAAMAVVGALMLVTGAALLLSRYSGTRTRDELTWLDAVITGAAQGLATLPGLSRSGLTVSALLWRGVERREALTLSFLLSAPASLAAGLYAALDSGFHSSPEALTALAVSTAAGFVTIRALLRAAERVRFGWFVILVGVSVMASGILQALV